MTLKSSSYGKGAVRLSKVIRHADRHELVELSVEVICEGNFQDAHLLGDNAMVLPTDTQKNTVYIFAKNHPLDCIESFALALSEHFISTNEHFEKVSISIEQFLWQAIPVAEQPYPYSFKRAGSELWTTQVERSKTEVKLTSGIKNCMILKSTKSGFSDFRKDVYTTLKNTEDRVFATNLMTNWTYNDITNIDFSKERKVIENAILSTFATHDSLSVQHTLYAMGKAALQASTAIDSIDLDMPNKHHMLVNLSPFNLENNNEVFHVTDEPFGIIRGSLQRTT